MIKEFKEFIARGNVVDLAVGIIIGAAFTAIVNSLVADLINPIIGLLTGGTDFSGHYIVLKGNVPDGASLAAARDSGASMRVKCAGFALPQAWVVPVQASLPEAFWAALLDRLPARSA